MTLQTVGLQTHKWNNDIKSALFLLLYPAVITTSYMALTAVVLLDILYMNAREPATFAFGQVFHEIIMHWYMPYGLAFAFLGFVYYCNLNQLNNTPEEQFAHPRRRQELHTMLE